MGSPGAHTVLTPSGSNVCGFFVLGLIQRNRRATPLNRLKFSPTLALLTIREIHMNPTRTFAALASLVLISACASVVTPAGGQDPAKADEHASHHPADTAAALAAAPAAAQERMKAMKQMHDRMMNAKTPAEKQALMADHMKAMQDGMQMMMDMMMQCMHTASAAPMTKQRSNQ